MAPFNQKGHKVAAAQTSGAGYENLHSSSTLQVAAFDEDSWLQFVSPTVRSAGIGAVSEPQRNSFRGLVRPASWFIRWVINVFVSDQAPAGRRQFRTSGSKSAVNSL
jgi:hypothetical protein